VSILRDAASRLLRMRKSARSYFSWLWASPNT
jgi:hypothetical protein